MNRLALDSTDIVSVGYNPRISALELELTAADIRTYFNVPNEIFEGLMGADCPKTYFAENIQRQFKWKKATQV